MEPQNPGAISIHQMERVTPFTLHLTTLTSIVKRQSQRLIGWSDALSGFLLRANPIFVECVALDVQTANFAGSRRSINEKTPNKNGINSTAIPKRIVSISNIVNSPPPPNSRSKNQTTRSCSTPQTLSPTPSPPDAVPPTPPKNAT